jgi:hypothetical protein
MIAVYPAKLKKLTTEGRKARAGKKWYEKQLQIRTQQTRRTDMLG